jgi:hypothetical protein
MNRSCRLYGYIFNVKSSVYILSLVTMLSCDTHVKKTDLPIADSAARNISVNSKQVSDSDRKSLVKLFEDWKKDQIANGEFWPKDSCKPDIVMSPRYDDEPNPIYGFPDEQNIVFSYADLNSDGQIDQIVIFQPDQCDGGNGSMWSQSQILMLSRNGQYKTIELNRNNLFPLPAKDDAGFIFYDSIAPNKLYGTYYKFLDKDGHCCPSVVKQAVFDYRKMHWDFSVKKESITN